MNITLTQDAIDQMKERVSFTAEEALFLSHETKGTGCVVNGVSDLIVMKKNELPDVAAFIKTVPEDYTVAIDKRVDWVYDENLIIDYKADKQMFQLKSPNQMLNPRMTFRNELK
ncbi:iron-sulfur cluster biosynthesis family protein [Paenalkalicoccus suaedae]|uniref:Iron-sulfur cluster biosynthesis family protein n=1 Tax=Paenalkalicoccus suaedae TaxID=2592382 RepID=A0A859FF94_9BACI|nr:iron-sulfur cluster biosynthesis family protein [Paenalkalicoccus suaedae]QKS70906.1 iron-sulfur cluster biosynthesis family protein [Paenalkalicoccus suaedae]